jgi:hypothetical protein
MLVDTEFVQRNNTLSLTKLAPLFFLVGAATLLFRSSAGFTLAMAAGLWLTALIALALRSVTALTGRRGRPIRV